MTKGNKLREDQEKRLLVTQIELRSSDGQSDTEEYIEGYALKFEKWSERIFGYFKEIISRDALNEADMSDVVATYNHKMDYPLARSTSNRDTGKLQLTIDNIGLHFRFKPSNTSYAQDLKENIRSEIVNKCSFIFSLDYNDDESDEWRYNEDEKVYERRVNKIAKIHDISVVTKPAYDDTEVVIGARSLEKYEQMEEQRLKPQLDLEKLKLELDLLKL